MQRKTLVGALPLVASMLGDKLGVKVVIGQSGPPRTNGRVIYLPPLPAEDERLEALIYGFIDHESGHIRYTDFGLQLDEFIKSHGELGRHLFNVLEDIRIESAMMKLFPGTRKNLARMVEQLVKDGYFGRPEARNAPGEQIAAYLLYRLRADLLSQDSVAEYADLAEELVQTNFPPSVKIRLNALGYSVTDTRSTSDVLRLTERILRMLKEEEEKAEEALSGSQSSEGSAESGAGGAHHDEPQRQDATGQDDQAHPQGEPGGQEGCGDAADQAQEEGTDDRSGGGAGSGATSECTDDQLENLRKALNSAPGDISAKDVGDIVADAVESEMERVPYSRVFTMPEVTRSHEQGPDMSEVRRASSQIRARLASHIQTQTLSLPYSSRSAGRLNSRHLHRVILGDTRIYDRCSEIDEVDTAVMVLLDRSASMCEENRIGMAQRAAMALACGIEEIPGATVAVAAFPGNRDNHVLEVKAFEERPTSKGFGLYACGRTPMHEGMLYAIRALMERPERRKLMVVCTDGDPDDREKVIELRAQVEKVGIECLGVGIQTRICEALFPDSAEVTNLDELPSRLFELLQDRMLVQAA